jgi:GNAT superfamily N-acetyltransferase
MRRVTTADEAAAATELYARAFHDDPVWGWAFPSPATRLEHQREWWTIFLRSALPHGHVFTTDDGAAAAALWIPPDTPELTPDDEALVEPTLRRLVATHADAVLELLERFETHHPRDRPHFYLSLLGTHPDHRGRGLGMGLLAEHLATLDALQMPAYLESSNPINNARYERHGFRQIDEFTATADGGPVLACMWREPR